MKGAYAKPTFLNYNQFFEKIQGQEDNQCCEEELIATTSKDIKNGYFDLRAQCYTLYELDEENYEKAKIFLEQDRNLSCEINYKKIEILVFEDKKYKHEFKISIAPAKPNRKQLQKFFQLNKIWKSIRDALAANKIKSYIYADNQSHKISSDLWMDDSHWYRLLADGCLKAPTEQIKTNNIYMCKQPLIEGAVFFNEEDVNKSIKIKDIGDDKLVSEFLEKLKSGEMKLRAAVQLLFHILSQPPTESLLNKNTRRKKTDFVHYITTEATNIGFTIKNPQKDKDMVINEEKDVSNKDVEAIATLVRDLHAQKR